MNETRTMRAARLMEPRRIEIEETPIPRPRPGEVCMRIEGCGICGSNLAPWQGLPWLRYPLAPGELGHEAWGSIAAVGAGVEDARVGERCAFLSSRGFAEYAVADAATLVRAPEREPVFPGEALGCVFNILRRSEIRAGHWLAVIGIGFLGALLVQLAARAGARVVALSQRPFSLELARRMGAAEVYSIENLDSAGAEVMKITAGSGCEIVIEAAGSQAALDLASAIIAVHGRLVIAGYHQDGPRRVNMQAWNWRGIDVINAHERSLERNVAGMRAAAAALAAGEIDPAPLYTHAFSLDRCAAAFETLEARPAGFVKGWIRLHGAERLSA